MILLAVVYSILALVREEVYYITKSNINQYHTPTMSPKYVSYTFNMKQPSTSRQQTLRNRLKLIESAFDTDKILARQAQDKNMVAKYYRLNRLAYRFVHSRAGFVHMGISRDGVFKTDDLYEQGRMIQAYIDKMKPSEVLELAAGKAATTRFLARQNPDIHFHGMDLARGQLDVNVEHPANLTLSYGDYHDLRDIADNSVDLVYIIEALCHARNKRQVIAEVSRVLKPGGRFIVFDGYTAKSPDKMSELERYAFDLTFASMMVNTTNLYYGDFKKDLTAEGLKLEKEENLSQYVLPSAKRIERRAATFLKRPRIAKLATKLLSGTVTGNAVAGYLLALTTEMNIHQYWFTVAQKSK